MADLHEISNYLSSDLRGIPNESLMQPLPPNVLRWPRPLLLPRGEFLLQNRLHLCVLLLHVQAAIVLRVIALAARTVALLVRTVQIRAATTAPAAHLPRAILMLKHRWPTKSRPSRF